MDIRSVDGTPAHELSSAASDAIGNVVKAEITRGGMHFVEGVGQKTVITFDHPTFGTATAELYLPSGDNVTVEAEWVGPGRVIVTVPGAFNLSPTSGPGAAAGGNPACGAGAGDCCSPNGSPGCDDLECCNLICTADPFCCDTEWDGICADAANAQCGVCDGGGGGPCDNAPPQCGPGAGPCNVPNGSPGCDDCECCSDICAADPFCCDVEWDAICADAGAACGPSCDPPCPPGFVCQGGTCVEVITCPDCTGEDEGEACGSDTNGGCNSAPPAFVDATCSPNGQTWCGTAWATGGSRDTDWYLVDHGGGVITGDLCSDFPGVCFIVDGIGACSPVVVGQIGCAADGAAITPASADLPAGEYVVFVGAGDCAGGGIFEGFPCGSGQENYQLTITCSEGEPPCMSDDDCPPGTVCVDGDCIIPPPTNDLCEDATALDVGPGGSVDIVGSTTLATFDGVGTCGTSNTAPGVWYSVIGNGNTMTASTCNQANYDTKISIFCGDCGNGGGGGSDCCTEGGNGTPGCDDPECEALICGQDPFCCDVSWDGICAAAAQDQCEVCSDGPEPGGLICVDGLDDTAGCGGFTTELSWCANQGSEYLILVHGFGSAVGDFTLTVSDNGASCTPTVECPLVGTCPDDFQCGPGEVCIDGVCVVLPTGGCCQCDGSNAFCTIETEMDCEALGGVYLGDGSSCSVGGGTLDFTSSPNAPIPDNDAGGVSDTISVGDSFNVLDVDVSLNINHTWVGDLCVVLEHNGTSVEIMRRPGLADDTCGPGSCCGCSDDNLAGARLDDEGTGGSIEDQCAPSLSSPPNYTPNNPLSAFDGMDSSGDWTLTVSDGAGADTGSLVSWTLHLEEPAGGGGPCDDAIQCVQPQTLIIKGGACPAPLNTNSNGVTPITLAGNMDFDVTDIDLSSLLLQRCDGVGGAVAPLSSPGPQFVDHRSSSDDPATCDNGSCNCGLTESDGFTDLKLKFSTSELAEVLELDGEPMGAIVSLELVGATNGGAGFSAVDCVRLVPPGSPPGVLLIGANLPGVWVDVTPLDDALDEGGWTSFNRAYPQGTIVTINAPQTPSQNPGWRLHSVYVDGEEFAVIGNEFSIPVGNVTSVAMKYIRVGFVPGGPGAGSIGTIGNGTQ